MIRLGAWLAGRLGRGTPAQKLGRRGERWARRWLKSRGYRILDRNTEIRDDEADLIALDPDGRTLVIVEVKTRTAAEPVPELAITRAKQQHLVRLAARLQRRDRYRDTAIRFDVLVIIWPEGESPQVRHHPGAFESSY